MLYALLASLPEHTNISMKKIIVALHEYEYKYIKGISFKLLQVFWILSKNYFGEKHLVYGNQNGDTVKLRYIEYQT